MRINFKTLVVTLAFMLIAAQWAFATSQWSRKTGMSCNSCHSVLPRLNEVGENFLKYGYRLDATTAPDMAYPGDVALDKVDHLVGVRLNMTPFQLETNSLQEDPEEEPKTRVSLGNPVWIQVFVAGAIYKNISFFSELEHSASAFKFNWFYFNFTNLLGTSALNFQAGNISPVEFASFPNRLPQLPALKSEAMLVKSSNGIGEESVDMSSARTGIQYFGYNDWGTIYAGLAPGPRATDVNGNMNF